jgi:hypothetical protein
MKLNIFEKSALFASGLTAVGIGSLILFTPHSFYASSGISLGDDASLLSELKAPAAGLLIFGMFMLIGIMRYAWAQISVFCSLAVFITFPAGRLMSIAFDGLPSAAIIGALIFELLIAVLCLTAFRRRLINSFKYNNKIQIPTA